jgi:ATP phosphoribosyltransferase
MLSNQKQKDSFRISIPSKGRLSEDCFDFMAASGLKIYKPNPRQYEASIPALPQLNVLLQRPSDILTSVRDGSVDFGITGYDVVAEYQGKEDDIIILHEALGFGGCSLKLAVPENWAAVNTVEDLKVFSRSLNRPLRIGTKYKNLVGNFFTQQEIAYNLVSSEGTLEIAPAIGYADMICDVVSSGLTLRDNRLKPLQDGKILESQAVLIANRNTLQQNPAALNTARILIEYFEAHLVGKQKLALFANMRGDSAQAIADRIFGSTSIQGLQGPTISPVIVREDSQNWFAVNIVVLKEQLYQAVSELRAIGGSGVIVLPVMYVFDEEPPRYRRLLDALENITPTTRQEV